MVVYVTGQRRRNGEIIRNSTEGRHKRRYLKNEENK
jgi:hypothetical protein